MWSPLYHSVPVKTQHLVNTKAHLCAREASAHRLATPGDILHIWVKHERASRQRGSWGSLTPDQTAFIRLDAKGSTRISTHSMRTVSIMLMLSSRFFSYYSGAFMSAPLLLCSVSTSPWVVLCSHSVTVTPDYTHVLLPHVHELVKGTVQWQLKQKQNELFDFMK